MQQANPVTHPPHTRPHLALAPLYLAVATALLARPVSAASEQPFELQSVQVSAARVTQAQADSLRQITVLGRDQLDAEQPQTVAQALQAEPNLEIAGGPRPYNQQVAIRGLSGSKVLQTVDGVQQRFESGHRPNYFLDPVLIRQVEVIKGPASSLWGSGAVGGVVALQTVDAADLLSPSQQWGGLVKTGYTDNHQHSASTAALAGRSDSLDWLLSGYYRDGDDLVLGNGEALDGSATRDQGGLAKLDWALAADQQLGLSVRRAKVQGQVPSNGSAASNGSSNFEIARDQTTQNAQLDYTYDPASDGLNLQATLYLNDVRMDEQRTTDGRADLTESRTLGFNLVNQTRTGSLTWLYGVDGFRESFSAERGGSNRPTPPEAENRVYGGFVNAQWAALDGLVFELGARHDYFSTEARNLNTDRADRATSPSAAVSWAATDWLRLGLRHDQAFRAPGSEELYTSGYHFCMGPGFCNAFVPNPELAPEKAANTELRAELFFADLWADDALTAELNLFENRVDDFIEQVVVGPSFFPVMDPGYTTWVNVDEARLTGAELALHYQRNHWQLRLAYGQTRGEDQQTGEDLTGIPADKWTLNGAYQWFDGQLKTGGRVMAVSDQTRTDYAANSSDQTYDGYTLIDLYAEWRPASLQALQLDLTVNNLTDAYYRRAWSELYSPGRAITLAANLRF